MKQQKIRWGIVGLGRIARVFADDLRLVADAELTAVASSSAARAADFARDYGVPNAFGSYEELYACEEVDVIYVASMHHQHAVHSITAMKAGKHVLCEKPIAVNREQTLEMLKVAKEEGVFFMEAFWSRFNPVIRAVKELAESGALGELRYVKADFSFYTLDADPKGRVLNPEYAGGSVLDVGVYPLFLSYLLLGMPSGIKATSVFYHTGAEVQTSMLLQYTNAQGVLYSGFAHNSPIEATIAGEKGEVIIHPNWHEAREYTLVREGEETRFSLPLKGRGYVYEIEEVNRCIRAGFLQSPDWRHEDSLNLITLADRVREQAGIRFPFEKE